MTGKSCHSSATNSSSSTAPNTTAIASTIGSVGGTTTTTSSSSTTTTTSSHIQNSLKSLNKASYKISKPLPKNSNPNPAGPSPPPAAVSSGSAPPQQSQPPVYNIDKNDFRDVVQKLTGSPAHHQPRPTTPPPPPPPAAAPTPAATSRLHRIRPPPLAHLTPRPAPSIPAPPVLASAPADVWTRRPLSPLPPLPTVSAAAESPISSYMRRLRSSGSGQLPLVPSPTAAALLLPAPTSPLGFGCLPSPRTAYQMMLSPGMVFPTSPGVPLPSPRWGDP